MTITCRLLLDPQPARSERAPNARKFVSKLLPRQSVQRIIQHVGSELGLAPNLMPPSEPSALTLIYFALSSRTPWLLDTGSSHADLTRPTRVPQGNFASCCALVIGLIRHLRYLPVFTNHLGIALSSCLLIVAPVSSSECFHLFSWSLSRHSAMKYSLPAKAKLMYYYNLHNEFPLYSLLQLV